MVFITKYRRKVLTEAMIEDVRQIIGSICSKNQCKVLELNGEADHIHILFETVPTTNLCKLVNVIKTVSSRMIRKRYGLKSLKRNKRVLWSPSYFIASCGAVKIAVLERYVRNQGNKFSPPTVT